MVGDGGTVDVTGTQAEAQDRGIGSHQAQAVPARHEAALLGAPYQPVVESWNGCQGQLGTRLGKGLLGDFAHQLCLLAKMSKEHIQFGLNTHAHTRQHDRDQGRQGQLAAARKCAGVLGMAGIVEEFGGTEASRKILKQGAPTVWVIQVW